MFLFIDENFRTFAFHYRNDSYAIVLFHHKSNTWLFSKNPRPPRLLQISAANVRELFVIFKIRMYGKRIIRYVDYPMLKPFQEE